MPPHRRDAPLYLAALALFAAALSSRALAAEMTTSGGGTAQAAPSAAASASAGLGGLASPLAPPWASAVASVSSVGASAACSLFGKEASAAARDSRLGLVTAAACEVATNLELWLQPLLSGGGGGGGAKPFLPAGAKRLSSPFSSPNSDALAADRAAVASTAAAAASTSSGGSGSAASASATANARPVCSAALLFSGDNAGREAAGKRGPPGPSPFLSPVCSAPSLELVADGGRCAVESRFPHAVTCVGPSVVLEVTPPRCFLGDGEGGRGASSSSSSSSPARSLVVDGHCGPPASIATGGQRVFLGGKRLPAFDLNGSSGGAPSPSSLTEFDRAAAALSSWPSGWGGAPLADAKGLAELLAVSLLPGRVTATASVVEE